MSAPHRYAGNALLLAALACSGAAPARPGAGEGPARMACPSPRFEAFLRRFSESAEVQNAFTYFPLKMSRLVDGPDEPERVTSWRERASLRGPLFPSRAKIVADGLVAENRVRKRTAMASLRGADSDYRIDYRFVRTDCWYLAEVDDMSL